MFVGIFVSATSVLCMVNLSTEYLEMSQQDKVQTTRISCMHNCHFTLYNKMSTTTENQQISERQ